MDMQTLIEQAGIPFMLFLICMYYAFRLMVFKDDASVRGKDKPPLKEKEKYCRYAGLIIIFFGVASLIMALLTMVNVYAALIEISVATLIMIVLWKRMTDTIE
ncbi:MAG: hypothetical protein K6G07_03615 [Lachnospiraceae bacterium]|nr:hypothetical protein [Lachnospiraceae bacterium]